MRLILQDDASKRSTFVEEMVLCRGARQPYRLLPSPLTLMKRLMQVQKLYLADVIPFLWCLLRIRTHWQRGRPQKKRFFSALKREDEYVMYSMVSVVPDLK